MLDKEIIKNVKLRLSGWAFEDIHRASSGGAKLGAFILASCYIDYLASYYSSKEKVGDRYIDFVGKFLTMYNPEDLYHELRCKLVHNYSGGKKYEYTHNKPKSHLKPSKLPGRTIINLENFLKELKNARDQYLDLVNSNRTFRTRMVKKYKKYGILGPSPIDKLK